MQSHFSYLTYWLITAIIASLLFTIICRMSGCSLPSIGVFIVASSLVLGILGTDAVSRECRQGHDSNASADIVQRHLALHMGPMALSVAMLCAWPQLVGKPATWGSMAKGLGLLVVIFVMYLLYPLTTGEKLGDKLRRVYHLEKPWEYVGLGSLIAVVTGALVVALGNNLKVGLKK